MASRSASDKATNTTFAEQDMAKLKVMQMSDSSLVAKFAMSVGAASIAETLTYPLDLTKTRLQLQGEVLAGDNVIKYRGMIQTALGIAKEEVCTDMSSLIRTLIVL